MASGIAPFPWVKLGRSRVMQQVLQQTTPAHKLLLGENHLERRLHLGKAYHHSNQQIGKTNSASHLNEQNEQYSKLQHNNYLQKKLALSSKPKPRQIVVDFNVLPLITFSSLRIQILNFPSLPAVIASGLKLLSFFC